MVPVSSSSFRLAVSKASATFTQAKYRGIFSDHGPFGSPSNLICSTSESLFLFQFSGDSLYSISSSGPHGLGSRPVITQNTLHSNYVVQSKPENEIVERGVSKSRPCCHCAKASFFELGLLRVEHTLFQETHGLGLNCDIRSDASSAAYLYNSARVGRLKQASSKISSVSPASIAIIPICTTSVAYSPKT